MYSTNQHFYNQYHENNTPPDFLNYINMQQNDCNTVPFNFQQHNQGKLSQPKHSIQGDRFIPYRGANECKPSTLVSPDNTEDIEISDEDSENTVSAKYTAKNYKCIIKENYYACNTKENHVLNFAPSNKKLPDPLISCVDTIYHAANTKMKLIKQKNRRIPKIPEKILDAPEIVNDYYLSLIDWGAQNQLAVCLNQTLYIWNANDGNIKQLFQLSNTDKILTSVHWCENGVTLAVGQEDGYIKMWDVNKENMISNNKLHNTRVSSLSYNKGKGILASGGKDSLINIIDIRKKNPNVSRLTAHKQEVCGLAWSDDGSALASGGNDNIINIWNSNNLKQPYNRNKMMHKAAVKALAWCPYYAGVLASGGGSSDMLVKVWNTVADEQMNEFNTGSQITSLVWNCVQKELLSSHGFQHNQVSIWSYPDCEHITDLRGHKDRILNMCINPSSTMIVTASADESLRFWRISEKEMSKDKKSSTGKNGTLIPLNLR